MNAIFYEEMNLALSPLKTGETCSIFRGGMIRNTFHLNDRQTQSHYARKSLKMSLQNHFSFTSLIRISL